jgi:hypothetical protein
VPSSGYNNSQPNQAAQNYNNIINNLNANMEANNRAAAAVGDALNDYFQSRRDHTAPDDSADTDDSPDTDTTPAYTPRAYTPPAYTPPAYKPQAYNAYNAPMPVVTPPAPPPPPLFQDTVMSDYIPDMDPGPASGQPAQPQPVQQPDNLYGLEQWKPKIVTMEEQMQDSSGLIEDSGSTGGILDDAKQLLDENVGTPIKQGLNYIGTPIKQGVDTLKQGIASVKNSVANSWNNFTSQIQLFSPDENGDVSDSWMPRTVVSQPSTADAILQTGFSSVGLLDSPQQ